MSQDGDGTTNPIPGRPSSYPRPVSAALSSLSSFISQPRAATAAATTTAGPLMPSTSEISDPILFSQFSAIRGVPATSEVTSKPTNHASTSSAAPASHPASSRQPTPSPSQVLVVLRASFTLQVWNVPKAKFIFNLNNDSTLREEWDELIPISAYILHGGRSIALCLVSDPLGGQSNNGSDGSGGAIGSGGGSRTSSNGTPSKRRSKIITYNLETAQPETTFDLDGTLGTLECAEAALVVSSTSPVSIHILHPATLETLMEVPHALVPTSISPQIAPPFSLSSRLLAYTTASAPATEITVMKSRRASEGVVESLGRVTEGGLGWVGREGVNGLKSWIGGVANNLQGNQTTQPAITTAPEQAVEDENETLQSPLKNETHLPSAPFLKFSRARNPSSSQSAPPSTSVVIIDITRPHQQPIAFFSASSSASNHSTTASTADVLLGQTSESITHLSFSPSSLSLLVSHASSQTFHVYSIRPPSFTTPGAVWETYLLRRGLSKGSIASVSWAQDERWVGVATKKGGTIHIYSIRPLGGKISEKEIEEGRLLNSSASAPLSVAISPVFRFRPCASGGSQTNVWDASSQLEQHGSDQPQFQPAFYFLSEPFIPSTQKPFTSNKSSQRSPPRASQDIAIFDPQQNNLTTHRLIIHSLPSTSLPSGGIISGLSKLMTAGRNWGDNLVGEGSEISRWSLDETPRGDILFPPIQLKKKPVFKGEESMQQRGSRWLSQAEIETSSTISSILPPPIYLSHQFNFFSLDSSAKSLTSDLYSFSGGVGEGERSTPLKRLTVRREVEVSPIIVPSSYHNRSQQQSNASSFDQPILHAIQDTITSHTQPSVIPGFPNAEAGLSPKRFTPNLSESVDRLRRELGRASASLSSSRRSSARSWKNSSSTALSLSFEDNAVLDEQDYRLGEDPDTSLPSQSPPSDFVWEEDADTYSKAIEEEGEFDDIVCGIFDDEVKVTSGKNDQKAGDKYKTQPKLIVVPSGDAASSDDLSRGSSPAKHSVLE